MPETTLDWLKRIVAFDTTSRNSNLSFIETLKDYLESQGFAARLIHHHSEKKANLIATLPASNGATSGGLILSGHTDTVPVDGQTWDTDPFSATLINDKIYGRGTCDMKGFIAVTLALVPELKKIPKRKAPIHFSFTYDEETGCRGVPSLIQALKELDTKPKACIVGEPSNMLPVVASKGIQVFRCEIKGLASHSSLTPQGCNAIDHAATLIRYIRELARHLREEGPFDEYFDVPFSTISTNLIRGGIADNTIPDRCEFNFELRYLPLIKPQDVINKIIDYAEHELLFQMQKEYSNAHVEITLFASAPSFDATNNIELTKKLRDLTGENKLIKVAYATEAGFFQSANIPTIICGPGSIEQAHRANEYVTLDQLNRCENLLKNLCLSTVCPPN